MLNSLCSLFHHFMKESPPVQYADKLIQNNLIEIEETWCLLLAKN